MKKLTILSSAILLAGGWQLALAQPPGGGGGGGRGGFGMTFDGLNTDKAPGTKNEGQQVLTAAEVGAFFEQMAAGRAGGGAPAAGGAAPAAGGGAPPAGGGGGGGRGGFDPTTIFAGWDANSDGEVTQAEFDARPQRGRGAGGPPGGGAAPAQ